MRTRLTQFFQRKFVRDTLTLQAGKVGVLTMSLAASVIVPVVMGPAVYGQWQLVVSLYGTWQFLNLTGVIVSAQTRLAAAVGADNADEVLNILGVSVRLTLLYCALSTLLLWAVAGLTPVAGWLYDGDSSIIWLAVLLTLTQPTELLYQLVIVTFSSRRQMSHVAAMQNANQFIFVGATIIAVLIRPRPATLVAARLIYSLLTLSIILVVYQRTRAHTQLTYPSLMTVVRAVPTASSSGYWRFGVTNALDKNTGNLFAYLPVQMAGAVAGDAAAGYVGLALNALRQQTFFTASILDNLQAVVPQSVGRGDYARLWRNFSRVLLVLAVGSVVFYGGFALVAPYVVPLLGEDWLPVIPLLQVLALYGAIVTVGGVFGPLYRAFDFVRGALLAKAVALVVGLPAGWWLVGQYGDIGAAWLTNILYGLSVVLTVALTLPELRRRARAQTTSPTPQT